MHGASRLLKYLTRWFTIYRAGGMGREFREAGWDLEGEYFWGLGRKPQNWILDWLGSDVIGIAMVSIVYI